MKRKTSLLIIYLATSGVMSGLVPGAAFAEDKPAENQPVEDQPAVDKTAEDPSVADKLAESTSAAEDKPVTEGPSLSEEGEPIVPVEFISKPILNEMQLGIGYVSDDAYKFGRYNGMQTKGPFIIGDFKGRYYNEDGRFWSVRGTNLGLESRYLLLEGGVQGSYKFFLEYDELPNYKNNTVQTPTRTTLYRRLLSVLVVIT